MKDYEIFTLSNGLRVVHRFVSHTKIAHCGFVLDVGSRDEHPEEHGIAHFWEHMAFKGTQKRKSFHIINRLEVFGGELNAYTTKEKICFYASILDDHYEKAVDLLADITFNSTFPEKEIEKEKTVILEEMSMYEDSPEESVHEDFEELIYGKHSLAHTILGKNKTVKSFQKKHFIDFLRDNLDTRKIIFSSVGNIPLSKVKKLAEKYFSEIPLRSVKKKRSPFSSYKPKTLVVNKKIQQAHCILGNKAYSIKDEKRLPFFMLINLLGGPSMNSRLNMSLREKHGLVYNVEANYNSFVDTGNLSIYFGTEKKQVEKSLNLVKKELRKLKDSPLGSLQLHTCKEQLIGQLAMAEESNISFMQMMGKSLLDLGQIEDLNEIFKKIRKTSALELQEIAEEIFDEDQFSYLTYLPE